MKFYNRETEIQQLQTIEQLSFDGAQMTYLVGRRRIGKTSLLLKAYENSIYLYFFVAKKSEALLCEDFAQEIKLKLNYPIYGTIKTFKDLFSLLIDLSIERQFTLLIDEFQEFQYINSSIYSDMQNIWDRNKSKSKLNLVLCGSVYSLMTKIFQNNKEPLFGRANFKINLKKFNVTTLKEILTDYYPTFTNDDLLAFYLFTGGVAKYVEIFVWNKSFTFDTMLNTVFSENSFFLEEGKNVLIEEFGKEYKNYFSILSLIASGKTSRPEIESILEMQTGGFLEQLENEYSLITKIRPIFSKPQARQVKFNINDNFLNFWFRYIYKYKSAIEIGNFDYLKTIIKNDYNVLSGLVLEKYFIEKLSASNSFTTLGNYWESGNKNEIDIVAVNDLTQTILFVEVKRTKEKINLQILKQKSEKLVLNFPNLTPLYQGFSLENM